MIGNLLVKEEVNYLQRVCGDLMQLEACIIRARRALDKCYDAIKFDKYLCEQNGEAMDAIVTSYTLVDLLLRDFPLSFMEIKKL